MKLCEFKRTDKSKLDICIGKQAVAQTIGAKELSAPLYQVN